MSDVKAPKVTIAGAGEDMPAPSVESEVFEEAATSAPTNAAADAASSDVPVTPHAESAGEKTDEPSGTPSGPVPQESPKPKAFMAWLSMRFPGHEYAVLGGFFGLFTALLVFSLGLLKALIVLLLIVIGIAAGQYLDGDPRLINIVRRFFGNDHT